MPSTPIEIIKEKLDIVDFLKGYLQLQAAGKNFKALCPFHREKTASFMVSPERQTWHCFGCNLGGDIFTFVMRYENAEFGEALKILAEKAGIELKRLNPAEHKYLGLLYEINEKAKEFFKKELARSEAAKKYLVERGLARETIEEFEIGFAPNSSEALTLSLINSGFHSDDILRAGLSFKTERGLQFDRFRGRIMFPIHNHFGKIVGFTGRVLPETQTNVDKAQTGADNFPRKSAFSQRESAVAKYMNSPETPIFNKSKLLYGFWKSKNFIRESNAAFLVEGQMDFLMSWQVGVRNITASSGTALTEDHLRVLRRLTDQVVVSFDNDSAGWEAAERAIDLAETHDFGVKVAIFKEYKDPAEAAVANKDHLLAAVQNAKPAIEFYFEKYLAEGTFEIRQRESLKNLRMVLAKIKHITSPVVRTFWLKELARRIGVGEQTLAEETENLETKNEKSRGTSEEIESAPAKKFSRREILSQRCLAAALARGSFDGLEDLFSYLPGLYQEIFAVFQNGERRSPDPVLDELMNYIVFQQQSAGLEEMAELKLQLYKEYLKERRQELVVLVRQHEHSGDGQSLQAVLQEFDKLPIL